MTTTMLPESDNAGVAVADGNDSTVNQTDDEQLQLVTFRVGSEEFGVDILAVQEINRMMQITRAAR